MTNEPDFYRPKKRRGKQQSRMHRVKLSVWVKKSVKFKLKHLAAGEGLGWVIEQFVEGMHSPDAGGTEVGSLPGDRRGNE